MLLGRVGRRYWNGFIRRNNLGEPSAKVGWNACKKEVLKKLRECEDYYEDGNGSDDYRVGESVFKEIEKL